LDCKLPSGRKSLAAGKPTVKDRAAKIAVDLAGEIAMPDETKM